MGEKNWMNPEVRRETSAEKPMGFFFGFRGTPISTTITITIPVTDDSLKKKGSTRKQKTRWQPIEAANPAISMEPHWGNPSTNSLDHKMESLGGA